MNEFKLIVAGGRDFDNTDLLARVLISMADDEYADKNISIVSGMARGADMLGHQFAKYHDIKCYEFPADWSRQGKSAGFARNKRMGDFADGLLALWDGQSRGTKHMIDYMYSLNKPELYTCSEVKYLLPHTFPIDTNEFNNLQVLCANKQKARAIKYLRDVYFFRTVEARAICTAIAHNSVVHS